MQLPNFGAHNKLVWIGLIGGAVALGLYLRRRSATGNGSVNSADGTNDLPNSPDISGDALNPYDSMSSGTADTSGGAAGVPGIAGPPGPRGPRGKPGHSRNQHHGNNHNGHSGNGGGTTHHRHHRNQGTESPHKKVQGPAVSIVGPR